MEKAAKHRTNSLVIRIMLDDKRTNKLKLLKACTGISCNQLFSEMIAEKIDEIFDKKSEVICERITKCNPK